MVALSRVEMLGCCSRPQFKSANLRTREGDSTAVSLGSKVGGKGMSPGFPRLGSWSSEVQGQEEESKGHVSPPLDSAGASSHLHGAQTHGHPHWCTSSQASLLWRRPLLTTTRDSCTVTSASLALSLGSSCHFISAASPVLNIFYAWNHNRQPFVFGFFHLVQYFQVQYVYIVA